MMARNEQTSEDKIEYTLLNSRLAPLWRTQSLAKIVYEYPTNIHLPESRNGCAQYA